MLDAADSLLHLANTNKCFPKTKDFHAKSVCAYCIIAPPQILFSFKDAKYIIELFHFPVVPLYFLNTHYITLAPALLVLFWQPEETHGGKNRTTQVSRVSK